jgi:hypothetical protein
MLAVLLDLVEKQTIIAGQFGRGHENMNQLNLFTPEKLEPITGTEQKGLSIDEAWAAFHEANPHIGRRLRSMALDIRERGFQRYSIKALWEVLRYEYAIQTDGQAYKLNNNYTALYARWIMEVTPNMQDFFETRERLSERRAGGDSG